MRLGRKSCWASVRGDAEEREQCWASQLGYLLGPARGNGLWGGQQAAREWEERGRGGPDRERGEMEQAYGPD